MIVEIVGTVAVLGGLGALFGIGLAKASKVFFVPVDDRVEKLDQILPGANCGGCGYAGCMAFAKALAAGDADPAGCSPGGESVAKSISEILGVEVIMGPPAIAILKCRGTDRNDRFKYDGIQDCRAADHPFFFGGATPCAHGCLGYGTCTEVCDFDALHMNEDGIPVVDADKCTACGACVKICPRDLFVLGPRDAPIGFSCSNTDKAKDVMDVCGLGCIACGKCVKVCKFDSLTLENNLILIDYDTCKGCSLCVKECPTGALWKTGRRFPREKKAAPEKQEETPAGTDVA